MTKNLPLVSIGIPTFNRSSSLERAIYSILNQTYRKIEIIVSDNCSPDATEKILNNLSVKYTQIKYTRKNENFGPRKNFEYVRDNSSGKYFMWLGDDDYLSENYIEKCVNFLENHTDYISSSGLGAYHFLGENKITRYGNILILNSNYLIIRILSYLYNVQENCIFHSLIRKDILEKCTINNDVLAGDWLHICTLLTQGKMKVYDDIFVHRDFGNTMSSDLASLVKIVKAPKWNIKYRNFAIGLNIWKLFLKDTFFKKRYSIFYRLFLGLTSIGVFMIRSVRENLNILKEKLKIIIMDYRNKRKYNQMMKDLRKHNLNYNHIFGMTLINFDQYLDKLSLQNNKYLLYGYGTAGKIIYNKLENNIVGILDQKFEEGKIENENGKFILKDQLSSLSFDYVIISVLGREHLIKQDLVKNYKLDINNFLEFTNA